MMTLSNILNHRWDPLWISVVPLLTINFFFLLTVIFFRLTYQDQSKNKDIDLKEHSKFLSRFFKEYWYWCTSPITKLMIKLKVTPNVLTLCGFIISCLSAYFFYRGMVGLGGWTMIFGATFDMFDGHIARLTGQVSKSGAFFDSVMDRFCEAVVFLGLAGYYRSSWVLYFVVLALVGSMMVSYTRARGEGVGVDVKSGLMQRPERIVYLGVGSIFSSIVAYLIHSVFHYPVPMDILTIGAVLIIAVFTNLTALHRMKVVIQKLDGPTSPSTGGSSLSSFFSSSAHT